MKIFFLFHITACQCVLSPVSATSAECAVRSVACPLHSSRGRKLPHCRQTRLMTCAAGRRQAAQRHVGLPRALAGPDRLPHRAAPEAGQFCFHDARRRAAGRPRNWSLRRICQPQCGCMVTQQAVRRLPRLSAASGSTSNGGGAGVQAAYGALLAKLSAELRAPAFTKLPAHLAAVTDPRRSSHFDSIRF